MYQRSAPSGRRLANVVETIWVSRADNANGFEVLLPTGRPQLVLHLDPAKPEALIQGPTTASTVIDASMQCLAAGVALLPGGLTALTGEAALDFTDQQVPVRDVLGLDVGGLIEAVRAELLQGSTTIAIERTLQQQLAMVDREPPETIRRSAALLDGGLGVAEVCGHLGVTRSRFVGSFRSEVGMNPKLYSRLKRFERALARVRNSQAPGLAAIAARSGYADQAHMTREFTEFTGRSPSLLHRDASPAPNHLQP
ncbi:MAG: helix-turn-helix transcriptional regulator [Actinomycetota bacterium]